ncbi:MAG: type VI secretion system baseplate subunit TssF [Deltaproteobacteria bacterium]|nr:type VI secretion system baseplate subunit TssF [Deltaproteobacteria bacterium]
MDTSYYQRELAYLRALAAEFSRAHPALAPLLSGPSSDPDVERLLEGMTFISSQLTQQLDESYDRLAENLMELVLPQLLRDIPGCTIMRFTPKPALTETIIIPRGSRVASTEVDGVSCIFSTTSSVELSPLSLAATVLDNSPGKRAALRLDFAMAFPPATATVKRLRLYLCGSRPEALSRLYVLHKFATRLVFQAGKIRRVLPGEVLKPVGFAPEDGLFPYPATALPCYRLLQEYYLLPEKFLFLDIPVPDLGAGKSGVESFSCTIELRQPDQGGLPTFTQKDLALFATPAVNLFAYETIPVRADHRQTTYPVRANTSRSDAYYPYHIESVKSIGLAGEKKYPPLLSRGGDVTISYKASYRRTEQGRREMELYLSYPQGGPMPEPETLSLEVLYSNGDLPARLKSGDVRLPLSSSPALAEFENLLPPTGLTPAPAEGDMTWAMLAHLHLNYLPLTDVKTLRAMLLAYLPEKTDALYFMANKKRIESIVSLTATDMDYLWKGRPVRGTDLALTLDESCFVNTGGMYLFAMVVAVFLHEYSPINSFVRVTATDTLNRNRFQWLKHM